MNRFRQLIHHERGSAPVEFVLTGTLLAMITLAVLQLSLSIYVRNTVIDATAEGARFASLADHTLQDGLHRTEELIHASLGAGFETELRVRETVVLGQPAVEVIAITALPIVGVWGFFGTMEVNAVAAQELRR